MGLLLDKSLEEASEILDRITSNGYRFPSSKLGTGRKAPGTYEFDTKDSEIITKKRKVEKYETVGTTKEFCLVLSKLTPKQKDLGNFIIPCWEDNYVGKTLCDIVSSVNLKPQSIFFKLGMGNARPTSVILQLVDRSLVRPEERVEDFIVQVEKFVFQVDFLILDCEVDTNAPIILGRPFLATSRILIDCEKDYERLIEEQSIEKPDEFPLKVDRSSLLTVRPGMHFEPFGFDKFVPPKPPFQHAPIVELKTLPKHLKYAYLGGDEILPVIISSNLTFDQEHSLLSVL
ncbi:uncharacterized protein LOC120172092 [Hibiscus syriacus]|uniref:uncharacterized protein LOC120172092 n=1 Tax=Hibiscus syriacus TaxID=106335 RepID=UPI0019233190|nr:uncharacterized protein LOC120172092 [Hibiscus syriacus]